MSHTLLVVALVVSEVVTALLECLADTYYTAVSEYAENALDKLGFLTVKADVLVVEEFNEGLAHSHNWHLYHSLIE
jgi:hypothetical protein